MRTHRHPLKNMVRLPAAPELSLCVVTHYTNDKYHAERMDVVNLCFQSMLAGIKNIPHELLIFDNESTVDFRCVLMKHNPTAITLSANIGAHNARRALVNQARGKLICMADDDILFHPDWFHYQLEVLLGFPNVGTVSGSPQRTAFRFAQTTNRLFCVENRSAKIKTGRLIPDQYEQDYCQSVGSDWQKHKAQTAQEQDTCIEYNHVKAYAHGHHMQYLGYTDIVRNFETGSDYYLANGRDITTRMDNNGLLTLTTYRRTAIHIGNVVDDRIREIAKEWQVATS